MHTSTKFKLLIIFSWNYNYDKLYIWHNRPNKFFESFKKFEIFLTTKGLKSYDINLFSFKFLLHSDIIIWRFIETDMLF